MSEPSKSAGVEEIAIISMDCRFPGADHVEAFWENLRSGTESITFFSDEDLAHMPTEILERTDYVKAMGCIENVDLFDAGLFDLSPREAQITDPQQRLFLEVARRVLERAGYNPDTDGQAIGLFGGAGPNAYLRRLLMDPRLEEEMGMLQLDIGNATDHITPRLSYLLNLRGPSVPVQTACSTSLVAVHLACQSLINYECDMALAGGSSIPDPNKSGYFYQDEGILSPDGHCRAFDADCKGTVPGSGVGVVLLKRLEDALADNDTVLAVIKGSAINNDGSAKVGYTAPSVEGQRRVIREALAVADLEPQDISYVETHGTGTVLGDPIEIEALRQAFGPVEKQTCAIGSVKTNLGHCNAAAGVAGLIKTVLCLQHKTLVPSLHFNKPNPKLDLENSPFHVQTETAAWEGTRRIAGVSSFGIGGTNAHVILQEAPNVTCSESESKPWESVTVSAKTEGALKQQFSQLKTFVQQNPELNPADMAYTLNVGRQALDLRASFTFKDRDSLLDALEKSSKPVSRQGKEGNRSVIFLFPGQGAAYDDLGAELYQGSPMFREKVDECCKILKPLLELNLADFMFSVDDAHRTKLMEPICWQPALFVSAYAAAHHWMAWGIRPEAMMGHSVGEYVAATLAGVLSLSDALKLIAARGKGTQSLKKGSMIAVTVSEEEIKPFVKGSVALAAVNGPSLCVLSGPDGAINETEADLKAKRIQVIRLASTHAFHSEMMDPLVKPLNELAAGFELSAPQIPFISNVTGSWMTAEDATDANYWGGHLRQTVRFSDGLALLCEQPHRLFLEVGPGKVLTNLTNRHPHCQSIAIPSLDGETPSLQAATEALGKLWCEGLEIDWPAFYGDASRRRILLPTYPFEGKSYMYQAGQGGGFIGQRPDGLPATLDNKANPADWIYVPTWEPKPLTNLTKLPKQLKEGICWLLFSDELGFCDAMAKRLEALGQLVVIARQGDGLREIDEKTYTINPADPQDFDSLLKTLASKEKAPSRIIHAFRLDNGGSMTDPTDILTHGFNNLVNIVHSLENLHIKDPVKIGVLTNQMQQVHTESVTAPDKATLLGPAMVFPLELPDTSCRAIDLQPSDNQEKYVDWVIADINGCDQAGEALAYRGKMRYEQSYSHIHWESNEDVSPYKEGGTYVILNAMQEFGMILAEHLGAKAHANVVMIDRAFFPDKSEWESWITDQGEDDVITKRIRMVQRLAALGVEPKILNANTGNSEQLLKIKEEITAQYGTIDGVFFMNSWSEPGLVAGKSPANPSQALKTKLQEGNAVSAVFEDVGFLVLFADNPGETGIGFAEQEAAYNYVGRLALALDGRRRVSTIDWGTVRWEEPAMAAQPEQVRAQLQEKRNLFGMTGEECMQMLSRVLMMELPRAIISSRTYSLVLEQQRMFTLGYIQAQMAQKEGMTADRPDLSSSYVEPTNDMERIMAEDWQSFFGIEPIGIQDNFFELGGHSLLAVQLLNKANNRFDVDLTLQHLFQTPTIEELARVIEEQRTAAMDEEAMEALLAEIEGLSDEDTASALSEEEQV